MADAPELFYLPRRAHKVSTKNMLKYRFFVETSAVEMLTMIPIGRRARRGKNEQDLKKKTPAVGVMRHTLPFQTEKRNLVN